MLENPRVAAPVLLDTENLMRAFGYETHDERVERSRRFGLPVRERDQATWDQQRLADAAELQAIVLNSQSPEGARSTARRVLASLISWAKQETGRELQPRQSYGKTTDSAVIRLNDSNAFEPNRFEHIPVPPGKNEADEAINRRIDDFRFIDQRDVMVVGSEDGDVWLKVLDVVDAEELDPIRFWLILPSRHQGDALHRRLFETWTWQIEPGRSRQLTVDRATAARRRQYIHWEYLNVIHRTMSQQRKRGGELGRADHGATAAAARAAEPDWTDVLDRIAGVIPHPSRSTRLLFGPGEWEVQTRERLAVAFGPDTAQRILDRVKNMAVWLRLREVQLSSLLLADWEAFVFISIHIPIRYPDWPDGTPLERDRVWRDKQTSRRNYDEGRQGS
jgi:hypothetical protein